MNLLRLSLNLLRRDWRVLCISPLTFTGEGERMSMSLLGNVKTLRRNLTNAEQKLWYHLRAHRFMGRKFKRQKPIGHYVVDFICLEEKLIIELDGGQHAENLEYDHERDAWLRSEGYTVLRFWNNELMNETEGVLERIRIELSKEAACSETLSPGPSPTSVRGDEE